MEPIGICDYGDPAAVILGGSHDGIRTNQTKTLDDLYGSWGGLYDNADADDGVVFWWAIQWGRGNRTADPLREHSGSVFSAEEEKWQNKSQNPLIQSLS